MSGTGTTSRILAGLRQACYPRALRIDPPAWPPELAGRLAAALEAAAQATAEAARAAIAAAQAQAARPETPQATQDAGKQEKLMADLATRVWRIRRSLVPHGKPLLNAQPVDEMRKPYRHLLSTWEALEAAGVRIQDHTGERYISGQSIKVHFEAAPELDTDTVIDTIRPTIYLNGNMIQMGEVLVGTPDLVN